MLDGKVAFVTGGSGAIGSAVVRAFAREGCRVAFSYHSHEDQARKLVEECNSGGGGVDGVGEKVRAYPLDVLDAKACQSLAETVEREFGRVDVLVNNAGIAQIMPFAMIDEKDWDLVMDVNVKGMFLVTKAFARGMIRRKGGSIINMSSLAGLRVLEVPVHYATAKSAVVGFTLSLAGELGRYNIRVNAIVPGMLTGGVSANIPARQQEKYKDFCSLSRAGEPAEVAELAAFLASDRSSYINAQSIFVDGGI